MPRSYHYLLRRMPPYPGASVSVSWGNHQEQCWAIIDTGADVTFIPEWLTGVLNLRRLNEKVDVSGLGLIGERELYVANLVFLDLKFESHPVVAIDYPEILIGRDIINDYIFTLDGPNRIFSIDTA